MVARQPDRLDEPSFRRWLDAHGETDADHVQETVLCAQKLITMIDFAQYKTDEQIYIALFSHVKFQEQGQIAQSKLKRAAILYHYFTRT